jgi:Mce-associated membrane protein
VNQPSWYDVLDVDRTASAGEIRAAWRSATAELEPGNRRFKLLNEAAEVLLDPSARAAYDARLAEDEAEPEPDGLETGASAPSSTTGSGEAGTPSTTTVPAGRSLPLVPGWLLIGLAVLAVAMVVATTVAWQRTAGESVEEATRAAQTAAEQAIVPVLSYDYETLDADQQRAQAYLTSDYRGDYDKLFGVISENAPSTKTKVSAEVVGSGIVRSGQDRVQVLVFVDRPTTNKVTPQPVVYKDQVTVTMQKVGDDWLVDDLLTSPVQQ